ncbi:reverse transcriptase domain-containing protein, partial [Tanacetum coccineum]
YEVRGGRASVRGTVAVRGVSTRQYEVLFSISEEDMLKDIQETFEKFRSINMKLNPKKCSFGVEEGPFLGHHITKQGIKGNPSKVKAVTDLEQPKTLKDIQSLNGKLAALSQFLSRGAERSLPLFKILKSCTDKRSIQWTQEAEEALQKMKMFMEILPTLTAPMKEEALTMYLTASTESIGATLFVKRDERQLLIYFVSRVLQRAKLNYPTLEKLILALVNAIRRLRRNNTKKEVPKDFLVELPFKEDKKKTARTMETKLESTKLSNVWKLYTDGASSSDGSGAGLMLINPEGKEYAYALRFKVKTTNNEVEYEALLARLQIAKEMEIESLEIFADSQLMVNQIKGAYEARQPTIKELPERVLKEV